MTRRLDPVAQLRLVAHHLGRARERAIANGDPWTPDLESGWLIASAVARPDPSLPVTSRQAPSPEPLRDNRPDPVPVMVLSLEDVAARLGRSRSTVERLARSGELVTIDVGGRPGVRPSDLEAFIAGKPPRIDRYGDDVGGVESA